MALGQQEFAVQLFVFVAVQLQFRDLLWVQPWQADVQAVVEDLRSTGFTICSTEQREC